MKVDVDDLVNVTMLAERANVARTNANAWTRMDSFPKPVAEIGGRVYLWSEVSSWISERNVKTIR